MTIPWFYLDKRAASIRAMKDFSGMRRIIENYHDDTTEAKAHLTTASLPMPYRFGSAPNPKAFENKVISTLHLLDVVEVRYQNALEYIAWFLPAWETLAEEERYLLSEFFLCDSISRAEILERIGNKLGYEKTAIYNRRDKAIERLTMLLYGR